MVFELFRGRGSSQIDTIEQQIGEMLATTHETFSLAMDSLLRIIDPAKVGQQLRKADKSVNRVERMIRRELVVHAGVHGPSADSPLLFVYMSISKDIERVGDINKDLWDLAAAGVDLSQLDPAGEFAGYGEEIKGLILETARVFAERDMETAARLLNETDEVKDRFDDQVVLQLASTAPASEAVARALLYRYLKRIVAHLMNVMTAVVMPLDRLDYWDEDRMDRE